MNLNRLLEDGIQNILHTAGRFYLNNPGGYAFILRTALRLRKSARLRDDLLQRDGTHIPPFLIASIASSCNLSCPGCYARASGSCGADPQPEEMTAGDWARVFAEASAVGVSFILLAGGEPLLRRETIENAARCDGILFPIFTNGTMIDDAWLDLFARHRHLIPVISVEGTDAQTDARRGRGTSERVRFLSGALQSRGILYGVSITVTLENKDAVVERGFVDALRDTGCGLIFYVEYVPMEEGTERLALPEADRGALLQRIDHLRGDPANRGMILLAFPGDEAAMGGCLAAGRGFFHINPSGGAEPCPFSPYSEMNLKEHTLTDVLRSGYFERVRAISAAEGPHQPGGCTLFHHQEEVRRANSAPS